MLARCFQHETDHLDGILFTDRLEGEDRKAALRAIRNANYDAITEQTTAKRAKTVGSSFGGGSFGAEFTAGSGAVRVLFAGTPAVAVPSLDALVDAGFDVVAVLTRPDAPLGRKRVLTPSPVAARAAELGIEVIHAAKVDADVTARIAAAAPGRRRHRRLRRADSPGGPGHSPPRLDQPALLPAAGLARRRSRAAGRHRR